MPRCACIDVGSNTTRLLVAEGDGTRLHELVSERAFTLMGATSAGPCELGPHKIAEVAAIVERQVRLAAELNVDSMRVVGTAAVRQALDKHALAAAIDAACGARLEILSTENEARLAFGGAIGTLTEPPAGPLGVVDVGGGSTELVVGTVAGGVSWSVSLPIGSARLTAAELPSDPPTPAELAQARAQLAIAFATLETPRGLAGAYAVGGSATSMQRLMGVALDRDALMRGLQALVTNPAAEVALRLGLHAERARLLPAAILLLDAASRALGAALMLAGGGLREGVVLEQLAAAGRSPPTSAM